jgi:hypothetical protein
MAVCCPQGAGPAASNSLRSLAGRSRRARRRVPPRSQAGRGAAGKYRQTSPMIRAVMAIASPRSSGAAAHPRRPTQRPSPTVSLRPRGWAAPYEPPEKFQRRPGNRACWLRRARLGNRRHSSVGIVPGWYSGDQGFDSLAPPTCITRVVKKSCGYPMATLRAGYWWLACLSAGRLCAALNPGV